MTEEESSALSARYYDATNVQFWRCRAAEVEAEIEAGWEELRRLAAEDPGDSDAFNRLRRQVQNLEEDSLKRIEANLARVEATRDKMARGEL